MLAMSGSSALFAWIFLIASATTIYQSTEQLLEMIACSQPDSFTVQITENKNVVVYGTELLIKYNPHAGIYPIPGIGAVNVVYNESTIEFTGYMSSEYPMTLPWGSPEILSWTSSGIILGTGTLQKLSREDYAVQECRLFLPRNIKSSDNLPFAVKTEIANHARYCIEKYLCRRLGPINTKEPQNTRRRSISNIPASYTLTPYDSSQNCGDSNTVHLNINEAMDLAIETTVNYIKQNNKSKIALPDVDESQVLGPFGMKCYFQAINGSFEDLSTLQRTANAYVSDIGQTHTIKLGLGLAMAKFHYDHYKINYGLMSISGQITGGIDGLAVLISLIVDYQKKCPVTLEYLKVTEFGDIKIKMTGLGPINNATSRILSWLTNMWRENLVSLIEVNAKKAIEEQLSKHACTSYFTTMLN